MERGLYEQLITEGLQRRLAAIADDETQTRPVDSGDQPHVLARHIEAAVHKALAATADPQRRLTIVNTLLSTLEETSDAVTRPASQLVGINCVLYGRETERALIDSLINRAAESRSGVLVLRGEPGIGKSALLDYAAENRASCHLLRGEGVESEVQLPYAALHQLLYPALDRVDALPTLQSVALRSAFGLASAPVSDRFLVAVAALTLISDLAADTGAPSSTTCTRCSPSSASPPVGS